MIKKNWREKLIIITISFILLQAVNASNPIEYDEKFTQGVKNQFLLINTAENLTNLNCTVDVFKYGSWIKTLRPKDTNSPMYHMPNIRINSPKGFYGYPIPVDYEKGEYLIEYDCSGQANLQGKIKFEILSQSGMPDESVLKKAYDNTVGKAFNNLIEFEETYKRAKENLLLKGFSKKYNEYAKILEYLFIWVGLIIFIFEFLIYYSWVLVIWIEAIICIMAHINNNSGMLRVHAWMLYNYHFLENGTKLIIRLMRAVIDFLRLFKPGG